MERKNGRNTGEVFTNKNVVQYILDEVGYISESDLKDIRILEPSSGKGAFALEIINRLFESSQIHGFSYVEALKNNITFIELDISAFTELCILIDTLIEKLIHYPSNMSSMICINTNYLTYKFESQYHCIVGNPPYIRHELIPEIDKQFYRQKFSTFKFRADLYIPFYEQSLLLLKPKGILSFICSNRWLYNQYGENLREFISTYFNLKKVLNIEKSSPFDEAVTAYPCITTIENKANSDSVLFCENSSKVIDFNNLDFLTVKSPRNSSWQNLFLNYNINHTSLLGIAEQGFEIGIGVATGADKVFIKSKNELNGIEKSRCLPLVKSSDLKDNAFCWHEHYLINPYDNDDLCDLEKYPHLKLYFDENKEVLKKRHTAQQSPEKWYKTIDKIKPELLGKPKLLLPDLTGNKYLFIDEGNYYPHHNIYYITADDIPSLKVLGSILMSDFIRNQMSQIGIRMNGGLPRFQSQVLKRLKIPVISRLSDVERNELIESYNKQNLQKTNEIIEKYCDENGVATMIITD